MWKGYYRHRGGGPEERARILSSHCYAQTDFYPSRGLTAWTADIYICPNPRQKIVGGLVCRAIPTLKVTLACTPGHQGRAWRNNRVNNIVLHVWILAKDADYAFGRKALLSSST